MIPSVRSKLRSVRLFLLIMTDRQLSLKLKGCGGAPHPTAFLVELGNPRLLNFSSLTEPTNSSSILFFVR